MVQSRSGLCFLLVILLLVTVVWFPLSVGNATSLSIRTTFDGISIAAGGNMFNVTVLSDADIMIDSFDIHLSTSTYYPVPVNVYYRAGGFEGYEFNASAWTFAGSVNVEALGFHRPTHVPIGGIRLTAGETYGFYISMDNTSEGFISYTSGSNTYRDSNLEIFCEIGQGLPEFSTVFFNRIWNGTIYYSVTGGYSDSHTAEIPKTGDPSGRFLWLHVLLAFGFGATILWLGKKRFGLFSKK